MVEIWNILKGGRYSTINKTEIRDEEGDIGSG